MSTTQQKVKILEVLPNEETGTFGWVLYSDYGYRGRIRKRKYCQSGDTKEWLHVSGRTKCMLFSRFVIASIQKKLRKKNKQEGKKTKSCYRDIKDVYTIVLFETSPSQLHKFRDVYLHHFEQKSDTGAEMNLLQKYLFVTLDNFRSISTIKVVR